VPSQVLEDLRESAMRTRLLTQVLSFHTLAHSFAFIKNSTLLFSCASALFAQNHPGGGCSPQSPVALMNFVCAEPTAALRCTQFPPLGGFHATIIMAHRHTGFHRSPLRSCTEACAHRQVRSGTRQRGRQSHPGRWSVRGLLHCAEELRQGV